MLTISPSELMWLKVRTGIICLDCISYCEGHFRCLLKQCAYDLSISPLALKCANDILYTRLLTLSPLAKVWMVISLLALTCDFTSTHTHTHYWLTQYWLVWFVTSFPPLLPSHSYWFFPRLFLRLSSFLFLLMFPFSSLSPSLHLPLSGITPILLYLLSIGSLTFFLLLPCPISFALLLCLFLSVSPSLILILFDFNY